MIAQEQPRLAPPPGDRELAADRRDREAQPEPEMGPPGEPLGEAVEHDPAERQRAQQQAQRIEQRRREDEERRPRRPPRPTPGPASARRAAAPGCRVRGLRASYCRSAIRLKPMATQRAAENASDHQRHRSAQVTGRCGDGCQHAEQRERQREEGVGKLDEVDVADEQRLAGEGLALAGGEAVEAVETSLVTAHPLALVLPVHCSPTPASSIPSFAQISSTRRLVASSIVISSGHSRSNPSSFHFRVASIPILLP